MKLQRYEHSGYAMIEWGDTGTYVLHADAVAEMDAQHERGQFWYDQAQDALIARDATIARLRGLLREVYGWVPNEVVDCDIHARIAAELEGD